MTPRERVEIALRGGHSDRVPFTVYQGMLPQCAVERALRNRGACLVARAGAVKQRQPHVKVTSYHYQEGDKHLVRTHYETPVGVLTDLRQSAGFTSWRLEYLYKKPEDYKVLLFLIEDGCYEPDYAAFAQAEARFGADAIFRDGFGLEPLQSLISGNLFGTEQFCLEWMERRDEIMKLYEAVVTQRRRLYPLIAQAPALHANYGGNVVPEIIGLETFERLYVPHYNEAAEIMHRQGKLVGCHFDANCRLLSKAIAGTRLDYIEAFTPAPDTDMSLGEARAAWPDKVIWINFPSSVHLQSDAQVEAATVALLNQLSSVDGIIFGITEDMPPDRWQGSCTAIMDGLERHARENPRLYR